jgi:hypothetical protein
MSKVNKNSKSKTAIPKNSGYIISNPVYKGLNSNIQILRITVTSLETKVDFGYQTTSYYINGGWIRISPKTFIRPKGSDKKFILTNATNIPYGPEKLHFNSSIEWRYFSLHFPPLPEYLDLNTAEPVTLKAFDLVENENGTENDFNFYGIRLDDEGKKSLLISR